MTDPLDDGEIERINKGHCPDCGQRGFVFGPRGAAGINIECASRRCRARFNVALLLDDHVVWGHRLPREDEGGARWG